MQKAKENIYFFPVRSPTDLRLSTKALVHALLEDGYISEDTAKAFLIPARTSIHSKTHPLVMISAQRWHQQKPPYMVLETSILGPWLAAKVGLPYFTIDPLKIDVAKVSGVVSYAYAQRYAILPLAIDEDSVTFAITEPFIREWEEELRQVLGLNIKRVLADPQEITRLLPEFYNLSRFVKQAMAQTLPPLANLEQLTELGRTGNVDADDHHIVALVDWLFQYAYQQRASDIHIEPRRDNGNVRFRIDGLLHSVYQMPLPVTVAIIARLKALSRMDVVEKRRPQDGRIKTRTPENLEVELRVSTLATAFGEKLVMRIFDPQRLSSNFVDLGFNQEHQQLWKHFIHQPYGIILVTGPTGSGKTTTLYATLKQLANDQVNVCTIEDPIEIIEVSFNQTQVNLHAELDFAAGIRCLLRQDPDIIMVGEIRDRATAEMVVQAALTGHLVLSTLHTNDAPAAITRLLELGIAPYLLSATLVGVVAQRLVRTLCPHCKQPAGQAKAYWRQLTQPWAYPEPKPLFTATGCLECRTTGFMGRIGLYEMFRVSDTLRDFILSGQPMPVLKQQLYREGFKPLRVAGAQKIAAGVTNVEEVLKVVPMDKHH